MTCLQRIQAALSRVRTVISGLRNNAEAETLRTQLAAANTARDAALSERDECVTAVETFADQVDPPAPDAPTEEEEPADNQDETDGESESETT